MKNFFALPTDEWNDNALKLTPAGIAVVAVIILVLIATTLIIRRKEQCSKKITTKQLVFSSVALALAMVTSMIKLFDLPMGGSITLLSMLFVVLIGYWYGPYVGIMTAVAYGLLQFVMEPIFYTIPQMITDYPLAFGALGLSGFFHKKKHGLIKGYIAGVLGRYFFAFLSGLIFFASYAKGSGMSAPIYSLVYNGSYLITEAAITLIIISLPPVAKSLSHIKILALNK